MKYFTPDSTFPFVWARYGRHSRGSKPQKSANALNVVFHRTPLVPLGAHTVPRSVVEMLLGVAAEVRERLLVRIEQFAERLAQTRHVEAPPREAERQHENVPQLQPGAEPHLGLSPVNLALQPRGRLEPRPRHRRVQPGLAQRRTNRFTVS